MESRGYHMAPYSEISHLQVLSASLEVLGVDKIYHLPLGENRRETTHTSISDALPFTTRSPYQRRRLIKSMSVPDKFSPPSPIASCTLRITYRAFHQVLSTTSLSLLLSLRFLPICPLRRTLNTLQSKIEAFIGRDHHSSP